MWVSLDFREKYKSAASKIGKKIGAVIITEVLEKQSNNPSSDQG